MSIRKIWKTKDVTVDETLLQACGNDKILAILLKNRGITTKEKINDFLNPLKMRLTSPDVNEIIEAVEEGMDQRANSRWYDIDRTVRAAINMLQNSPADTQKIIAKEMAKLVIDKIKEDKDIEELKKELEQEDFFDENADD